MAFSAASDRFTVHYMSLRRSERAWQFDNALALRWGLERIGVQHVDT